MEIYDFEKFDQSIDLGEDISPGVRKLAHNPLALTSMVLGLNPAHGDISGQGLTCLDMNLAVVWLVKFQL